MWRENLRCQIFGKIGPRFKKGESWQTCLGGTHAGLRGVTRQKYYPTALTTSHIIPRFRLLKDRLKIVSITL